MVESKIRLTEDEIKTFRELFEANKTASALLKELEEKGIPIKTLNELYEIVEEHLRYRYEKSMNKWIQINENENINSCENESQGFFQYFVETPSEKHCQFSLFPQNDTKENDCRKVNNNQKNIKANDTQINQLGDNVIKALKGETTESTEPIEEPPKSLDEKIYEILENNKSMYARLESLEYQTKIIIKMIKENKLKDEEKADKEINQLMKLYLGNRIKKSFSINEELFKNLKDIVPEIYPDNSNKDSAIIDIALYYAWLKRDSFLKLKNKN